MQSDVQPASTDDATAPRGLQPGTEVLFYNVNIAPPPKKIEKLFSRPLCVWLFIEKAVVTDDGVPGLPRPLAMWGPVPRKGLTPADAAILDVVEPYYRKEQRNFSSPHAHGIPLQEAMVGPVFEQLTRCPFVFAPGRQPVAIRPDLPVKDVGGPYESLWDVDGELLPGAENRLVGDDPPWIFVRDAMRPVVLSQREAIEGESVPEVAEPPLRDLPKHTPVAPVPRLNLSEEGDRLIVRLGFRYGTAAPIAPTDTRVLVGGELDGEWGVWERDHAAEQAFVDRLTRVPLDARGGGQYLAWGESALSFLMDDLPALFGEGWEIFGEERLKRHRVRRSRASVSVGVASGIDWFDLKTNVAVDGEDVSWESLREALKHQSRFVRLGDGAFARLPEEWLASQRLLGESLGFAGEEAEDGFMQRLPRYLAPAMQELLDAADSAKTDADWRQFLKGLEAPDAVAEVAVPEGFMGELRHYQLRGLARLCFWRDHGLRGILADDMGLGKTVQAIALLLSEKAAGRKGPSLLVAPTSVVYNWEKEIGRFAPDLRVLVLHGADRHARFEAADDIDVIVTSYGLLQRDRDLLAKLELNYVILDEAQKIKNPRSQAAKAASKIPARQRLCLTGTPIENNLIEFWSLFHFLMPGLLGSERHFRTTYLKALPEEQEVARDRLRRLTRPFILRRLKQEVAQDLPPRTEIVTFVELGPEQRKLYQDTLAAVRGSILSEVQTRGFKRARFHVLEGLLRLRQVVCDPSLVLRDGEAAPPSAKVEQFMDLLSEIIAEGHRVLVFSQFVKVLHILRDRLGGEGIAYSYLDGQTKDRLERVQAFNEGDTPVFLISLKAGGTGLNLTGADYVIHFDPWWNPAVEDQATDRAHRIGQTRHVFSYKLIAKDTVEEKVLSLQDQKRQMVRDVLGGSDMGRELTMEDLEYLLAETV